MLIVVSNLVTSSNHELTKYLESAMHLSVKWSCLWWQTLTVLATRLWTEITASKMKLGILNNGKTCLTVQFVVQNLHFYCCRIKLELSLEKNTLLFTINHRPSLLFQYWNLPSVSILRQNIPVCSLFDSRFNCASNFSKSKGKQIVCETQV